MSAVALRSDPPLGAIFSQQPELALRATRLTQVIKPINGVQNLRVTATNTPFVEFKLTSQNMMDPYGCYFNFDVATDAPTVDANGAAQYHEDLLGACSIIKNVTVFGPDGNALEHVANYNYLSHMMIKATLGEDYLRSCGSVMWGVQLSSAASGTYSAAPTTATETAIAVATKNFSLQLFLLGLFSSNTDKYFPLNKVHGGITLRIEFDTPRMCHQTTAVAGGPFAPTGYTVSNMSFIMDTVQFEDNDYDRMLNEKIANEGLSYFTDTFTNQIFPVPTTNAFSVTMNKIYSSLKGLYFCQQLNATTAISPANPTSMDLNNLASFNILIGSKQIPGAQIKVGAQSYAEMRKSFNKLNDFGAGGLISKTSYATTDAIFGVNLQNHLGLSRSGTEMISGVNTHDPSAPLNLQLDLYSSGNFDAANLYAWMNYDIAYYIAPDGRLTTTHTFVSG